MIVKGTESVISSDFPFTEDSEQYIKHLTDQGWRTFLYLTFENLVIVEHSVFNFDCLEAAEFR